MVVPVRHSAVLPGRDYLYRPMTNFDYPIIRGNMSIPKGMHYLLANSANRFLRKAVSILAVPLALLAY